MSVTRWSADIENHYSVAWTPRFERARPTAGPVKDLPSDFTVLVFPPYGGREMWTYATCCMSQPGDSFPIEVHMFSASQSTSHVELLAALAYYHRSSASLGLGHSVSFGRPWFPGSGLSYGLLSLPYLDGPALEWMDSGKTRVRFLWLIPVTHSEVRYRQERGVEALESRFEEAGFNYLDAYRPAVA